jgi:hypothetical protein
LTDGYNVATINLYGSDFKAIGYYELNFRVENTNAILEAIVWKYGVEEYDEISFEVHETAELSTGDLEVAFNLDMYVITDDNLQGYFGKVELNSDADEFDIYHPVEIDFYYYNDNAITLIESEEGVNWVLNHIFNSDEIDSISDTLGSAYKQSIRVLGVVDESGDTIDLVNLVDYEDVTDGEYDVILLKVAMTDRFGATREVYIELDITEGDFEPTIFSEDIDGTNLLILSISDEAPYTFASDIDNADIEFSAGTSGLTMGVSAVTRTSSTEISVQLTGTQLNGAFDIKILSSGFTSDYNLSYSNELTITTVAD